MKPTVVSFTYQGQSLSHFFQEETSPDSKMLKVFFIRWAEQMQGRSQTGGCPLADIRLWEARRQLGCSPGEETGEQLIVKENGTLKMPVTALHLWAGCSQGALFPSTGQISSDFFFFFLNVCFLLEVFCWRCPRATTGRSAWEPCWDLCRSSQISPSAESFFAELCRTTMPV